MMLMIGAILAIGHQPALQVRSMLLMLTRDSVITVQIPVLPT